MPSEWRRPGSQAAPLVGSVLLDRSTRLQVDVEAIVESEADLERLRYSNAAELFNI